MWRVPTQACVPECLVLDQSLSRSALAPHSFDLVGDVARVLVLPRPDDTPSGLAQTLVRPSVSRDVGVELGAPPSCVRLRGDGVLRTAMPEAPVNEDSNPGSGESDVRTARKGREVHAVTETPAMEFPAQRTLRFGSRRPEVRHESIGGQPDSTQGVCPERVIATAQKDHG